MLTFLTPCNESKSLEKLINIAEMKAFLKERVDILLNVSVVSLVLKCFFQKKAEVFEDTWGMDFLITYSALPVKILRQYMLQKKISDLIRQKHGILYIRHILYTTRTALK